MPSRFQLLPGALGVDLPDGRSIKADRRGVITAWNDADARAIRGSSAMHRYDAVIELGQARFHSLPGDRLCAGCNFSPWGWQTVCPRCGADL